MPNFTTSTMKQFADAPECERKFAPELRPHELIHNAIAEKASITSGPPRALLLVSDNLDKHELLVKAALPATTVIVVRYSEWTLEQLWDAIEEATEEDELYDVVGLLDHGAPGRFCLLKSVGDGDVDLKDLEKDDPKDESLRSFFDELGDLIEEEGRLDLLGCSVAASAEGLELIAALEELTGVTVAASVDQTGGAPDADWEMETEDLTVAADYFDEVQLAEWKEAAFVITGTVAAAALVTGIIGGVGKAVGEEATKAGVKAIKKKSKKSRRKKKASKVKKKAPRKKRRGKKKKKKRS